MASNKDFSQIMDILNDYSDDIQEAIGNETQRLAKEGQNKLRSTSPKLTGDYAKGWRVETKKGFGFVKCIIHNKTNYQLTHLLEKPHATRNGGITTPKIHIAPVEREIISEFQKNVQNIIKNGG